MAQPLYTGFPISLVSHTVYAEDFLTNISCVYNWSCCESEHFHPNKYLIHVPKYFIFKSIYSDFLLEFAINLVILSKYSREHEKKNEANIFQNNFLKEN